MYVVSGGNRDDVEVIGRVVNLLNPSVISGVAVAGFVSLATNVMF